MISWLNLSIQLNFFLEKHIFFVWFIWKLKWQFKNENGKRRCSKWRKAARPLTLPMSRGRMLPSRMSLDLRFTVDMYSTEADVVALERKILHEVRPAALLRVMRARLRCRSFAFTSELRWTICNSTPRWLTVIVSGVKTHKKKILMLQHVVNH